MSASIERTTTTLALLLAGTVLATAAAVDAVARHPGLAAWIDATDRARAIRGEELYINRGNYLEFEDRLLLEEIPRADYARGGVFFFGASNLKWALKTWELPPEERALIGNYGIGAVNHALELQFLRYLVEERGFGSAGGGRTTVVLGASWANAIDWQPESYFGPLFRRHGLYTYDARAGLHEAEMHPLARRYRIERARCVGFIGGNLNRLARVIVLGLGMRLDATERLDDPAVIRNLIVGLYGNRDYQGPLDTQMRALRDLADYLRERDIALVLAILPTRAAYDEVPLVGAYHDAVVALGAERGIPVVDLGHLLSEDEFWDLNHYNERGLEKTHAALMEIARGRLREGGLLP